ncbi:hypothetical protein LAZ67_4002484 [Cordylochernes scorpioides]|uniref:Reverse transcriptase Ty1/copia-type domain-containing protein n=1 Tax=Cordylochernes scorpioides TaxID=51811 RepID=A0ABY6KG82_9ARAC|nr:hypothetical protein LAZ67_4002484 [Cordylochernes scorpioides]
MYWSLGRITKVFPGADGKVRVVESSVPGCARDGATACYYRTELVSRISLVTKSKKSLARRLVSRKTRYAPNGYRLWDEQSKQIFTARDVIFLDKGCINKEEKIPIGEPEEESEDQLELNEEPSLPEVSEDKEDIPTKPSTSIYNLRPRSSLQTPSKYEDFYLERDGTTESALLTYSEAISGPNQEKWKKAIKEEKESLDKNEVLEIVKENESSNKKILTSKWLFKVEEDVRYKARLVVKGFEQEAGIDYDETFSPVISTVSLRIYFALMAKRRSKCALQIAERHLVEQKTTKHCVSERHARARRKKTVLNGLSTNILPAFAKAARVRGGGGEAKSARMRGGGRDVRKLTAITG